MDSRFAGQVVVITGGAGGIGRSLGAGFAAAGASVALVDVDLAAARSAAEGLAGGRATGHACDVADGAAVDRTLEEIAAEHGRIDHLVTLAGGSLGTPPTLEDITEADLSLVLDVNVKGTFHCAKAALNHMTPGGSIVTVSSIGGRQPSPVTGVPYAAAKAAVSGLTRKLAKEVGGRGIRVNSVAPGLFLTDRLTARYAAMPEEERAEVLGAIALARFPELAELVEPILFLCSSASSYITGVTLDVNGGRYMPL